MPSIPKGLVVEGFTKVLAVVPKSKMNPKSQDSYEPNRGFFIGIDPGQSGGLVSISSGKIEATPMPETEREIWNWFEGFSDQHSPISGTAVIEKVGGYIGGDEQAKGSRMFTFGQNYGSLRMCLIAAGIPFEEIAPRTWQKGLGISPKKKTESKGQWKNRLLALAQQLHPNLPLWSEKKSKVKMLAVADALLIAEYCKRKATGTL